MTCFICGGTFYGSTMSGPAEDCDCGGCWRRGDFDGPDDPGYQLAKHRWVRIQAGVGFEDDDETASAGQSSEASES